MKKFNKTPLAAAMGAAFISTFAATAANAEANPFGMTELSTGYMQVAEADKKRLKWHVAQLWVEWLSLKHRRRVCRQQKTCTAATTKAMPKAHAAT